MSKQSVVDRLFDAYCDLVHLVDSKKVEWPDAEYRVRTKFKLTDAQWAALVERYDEEGKDL